MEIVPPVIKTAFFVKVFVRLAILSSKEILMKAGSEPLFITK